MYFPRQNLLMPCLINYIIKFRKHFLFHYLSHYHKTFEKGEGTVFPILQIRRLELKEVVGFVHDHIPTFM